MKTVITFSLGVVIGAAILYAALWTQVAWQAQTTWCKIYTGQKTTSQQQFCDRYGVK